MSSKEIGHLGSLFDDHASQIEDDKLRWETMEKRLFPKSKRRGVLLWWIVGLAGLAAMLVTIWFVSASATQQDPPNKTVVGAGEAIIGTEADPRVATALSEEISSVGGNETGNSDTDSINDSTSKRKEGVGFTDQATNERGEQLSVAFSRIASAIPADLAAQQETVGKDNRSISVTDTVVDKAITPVVITPLPTMLQTVSYDKSVQIPSPITIDRLAGGGKSHFGGLGIRVGYNVVSGTIGAGDINESREEDYNDLTSVGLDLSGGYSREIGNGWQFQVGIGYQRLLQRLTFEGDQRRTTLFRPGVIDTIYRSTPTGSDRIITTDSVGGTVSRSFQHLNRASLLSLHAAVQRSWEIGQRGYGDLGVLVGASYTGVYDLRGRIPLKDGETADIGVRSTYDGFERLGLLLGVEYRRRISDSFDWTLRLDSQFGVGRGFNSSGLSVGLQWRRQPR